MFHADAGQLGGQKLGGAAAIALVLGQRGDRRNAQQILQLFQKTGVVLACVGYSG